MYSAHTIPDGLYNTRLHNPSRIHTIETLEKSNRLAIPLRRCAFHIGKRRNVEGLEGFCHGADLRSSTSNIFRIYGNFYVQSAHTIPDDCTIPDCAIHHAFTL
ncbi:hypothetical protein AVEN_13003-1 [Araneus ventricosus]|uniref:Uncharacterized protein n=1 Tax=Araneus ventricosus TaxID=182803 RepID=A0A4Y2HM14_ARAVE|nr:hypothetical protein AVEN_13003-1 [Araneus ventricosus]